MILHCSVEYEIHSLSVYMNLKKLYPALVCQPLTPLSTLSHLFAMASLDNNQIVKFILAQEAFM